MPKFFFESPSESFGKDFQEAQRNLSIVLLVRYGKLANARANGLSAKGAEAEQFQQRKKELKDFAAIVETVLSNIKNVKPGTFDNLIEKAGKLGLTKSK